MKTLFLDTSSFLVSVGIYEDNKKLYLHQETNHNKISDVIFNIIEEVFEKSNTASNEIKRVFIVNGPGSFTGIRIGLTIAKTYGVSLNIPVYPISTLELMASGTNKPVISLINDRNDFVYYSVYDSELNNIVKDQYININEIEFKYDVVSYDEFNFETKTPIIDIEKIIKKHENDSKENVHTIIPNYLKQTEAEKSICLD